MENLILLKNQHFIVLNKDPDIVINSNDLDRVSLEKRLTSAFPAEKRSEVKFGFYFPHRLDFSTSGVICVALSKEACAAASSAFQDRNARKYYLALLRGHVAESLCQVEIPIGEWEPETDCDRPPQMMRANGINSRTAVTRILVLERGLYAGEPVTKVLLKPLTGRRHQLRVHCQYIGHTIVGDFTYSFKKDVKPPRMCLHSYRLILPNKLSSIDVATEDPFTSENFENWTHVDSLHSLENSFEAIEETRSEDRPEKKRHEINITVPKFFTDQTPTPTRFIRNCEEVGLFQDLQNVNPFEETFRRAVESSKTGESSMLLGKPASNPGIDDTLHTPNIFPHISEPQPSAKPPPKPVQKSKTPRVQEKKATNVRKDAVEQHFFIVDRNLTFKLPIPRLPPPVKVFSPKYFSTISNNLSKAKDPGQKEKKNAVSVPKKTTRSKEIPEKNLEDIREINRLAASRTRQKKKHYLMYLEKMNKELMEKTKEMEKTILDLQRKNAELEKSLSLGRSTVPEFPPDVTNTAAKTTAESFYSSIPPSKPPSDSSSVSNPVFLIKPIKKRSFPPKLTIPCNNMAGSSPNTS